MQFRSDEYYRVSLERMRQARTIYLEGDSYALAIYCGGLAVESLLRAFRWKEDPSFEGRHDLSELLKSSRLLQIDETYIRQKGARDVAADEARLKLRTAMQAVSLLWHNNLRFACEASLKAFLRRSGRVEGVRGDIAKKNALDFLNAAQSVIERGVILWESKTRS
jgi:hypothetical protein